MELADDLGLSGGVLHDSITRAGAAQAATLATGDDGPRTGTAGEPDRQSDFLPGRRDRSDLALIVTRGLMRTTTLLRAATEAGVRGLPTASLSRPPRPRRRRRRRRGPPSSPPSSSRASPLSLPPRTDHLGRRPRRWSGRNLQQNERGGPPDVVHRRNGQRPGPIELRGETLRTG